MKSFNTLLYRKLLIALLISTSGSSAHATIYRWIDDNGIVNYSDEPVKNQAPKEKGALEVIEYGVAPKRFDSDIETTTDTAKSKKATCGELRQQLVVLTEKDFATYRDETGSYRVAWGDDGLYTGKREYLSQNEVTSKVTELTEQLEQRCEKSGDTISQDDIRAEWVRSEHCLLNQAILADLKKPDLKSANSAIRKQEAVTKRYCDKLEDSKHREDEDYYPQQLPTKTVRAN